MKTDTEQRRNSRGILIEYQEAWGGGSSRAEGRARVFVNGKLVLNGWASDGTTYARFKELSTS